MLVTPLLLLLAALPALSAPVADTAVERAVDPVAIERDLRIDERGLGAVLQDWIKNNPNIRIIGGGGGRVGGSRSRGRSLDTLNERDAEAQIDEREIYERENDERGLGAVLQEWLKNNPNIRVIGGSGGRVGGSRGRSLPSDLPSELAQRDLDSLDERSLGDLAQLDERSTGELDERDIAALEQLEEIAKRHPGLSSWLSDARVWHGFARPSKNPNWSAWGGSGGLGAGRRDVGDVE